MLNIICTAHAAIAWCVVIAEGRTAQFAHEPRSYYTPRRWCATHRMVRILSQGCAVMYGPRSLQTVQLNIAWFGEVLICRNSGSGIWRSPHMPRHLHIAKLMVTSNSYVTWHSPVASPYNVSWVGTCAWSWLQCFGDMERHGNITLGPWLSGMVWFSFSIWL